MTRFTLTIPTVENDGSSLAILHDGVARRIARDFDGLTILTGEGIWSDPSAANPGREDVRIYVVDTDRPDALDILRKLAQTVRRAAAQDCVYLTRQSIDAFLVV